MSHKIAKARRAAERNAATPNHMHLLLVDMSRQARRAAAYKLKEEPKQRKRRAPGTRTKGKIRQATAILRGRPLIVERPIRALRRKMFLNAGPVDRKFHALHLRWSKAEMDNNALRGF